MAVEGRDWPQPRAIYLHVPFCRHRCGYCNFSVVAGRDELGERFLAALEWELSRLQQPEVDTVFVGGGTPTQLPLPWLDRLLTLVRDRLQLVADAEWSVEANPEDITPEVLETLAGHGVNRLSLGVQSFNDVKLQVLERGHRGGEAQESIAAAAVHIPNLSIDLIFAAPGETIDHWRRDLQTALALPIGHLSTYALTFEKGTRFWNRRQRRELTAVGDEVETEMYLLARAATRAAGVQQYEISSFARPETRCRHNLAYWRGQPWYAAGPGAARFVNGRREVNHRSTTRYLKRVEARQDPTAERETISPQQYARERAAFGIRMIDGVDLGQITRDSGVDVTSLIGPAIDRCRDDQLLTQHQDRIRLTDRGILFADTVAARFLA